MNYWDKALEEAKKAEAVRVVREFVRRKIRESMGSGNSTSQADEGQPETEVEETY